MSQHDPPPDDDRLDTLLRAAARRSPPAERGAPDDAIETVDDGALRAWRTGRLDDEASAAIEGALAASAADRALLRAVASDDRPSEALLQWAEAAAPSAPAPARPRRMVRWGGLALAATVLVGVGVALWAPWAPGGIEGPRYQSSALLGGAQVLRGDDAPSAEVPVFHPEGRLTVRLRPEEAAEAPPVEVFFAPAGGALQAVEAAVKPAPGGAMEVALSPGALDEAFGEYRLYVALGEPDAAAAGRSFAEARDDGRQWFEYRWRLAPVEEAPP